MKSKSFDLRHNAAVADKTIEFVGLYKSAADTHKFAEKRKSDENISREATKAKPGTPKRESSPYKNKKRSKKEEVDISQINIDGTNLNPSLGRNSPLNNSKITSTPNLGVKASGRVKSIMKNSSLDQSSETRPTAGKPKKRNKSVSFMLDDNEEVVIKRTKSDDSIKVKKSENIASKPDFKKKNIKKLKKDQQSEKENKAGASNNLHMEDGSTVLEKKPAKLTKPKKAAVESTAPASDTNVENHSQDKKKRFKKFKKQKPEPSSETESNNNEVTDAAKVKKPKKKKSKSPPAEAISAEGEPVHKSQKKEPKPDIAEDLENLSIGDNAHTLTNLLDEMTVVDKEKRKKLRQKFNKNKRPKGPSKDVKEQSEKSDEVKEKVKWKKRKWNKDKKGDADDDGLATTVVVENLPLALMLNYKKLLSDHFVKYGLIKKIGLAEVYPTEESKPVFTTTITFYSDGAAEKALEENNTHFEGGRIRVKQALPATQTTVVVRSYAELTDQALSTAFITAGKIRSIRHLVKGKKSMATAFIEFDGPESVGRALKMVPETKIGGKKIHLAKFERRAKKEKKIKNDGDSAADADSEDSND